MSPHHRGQLFSRGAHAGSATDVSRTVRGVPHAGVRFALQAVPPDVEHLEHRSRCRRVPAVSAPCPRAGSPVRSGTRNRASDRYRARGDMTPTRQCHPLMSRPQAPCGRRTRVNGATSSARPAGADEGRIVRLNRERPHCRRFAALRVAPGSTVREGGAYRDAIDSRCCHRAQRHQGCPRSARRLRRP